MPHGYGTMSWANGESYEGDWVKSEMTGWGTFTFSEGSTYVGDHLKGKAHGQGTRTWSNGDSYEGDWVENEMSGHGTFTWSDGATYVGEFRNNSMHGEGTFNEPDGTQVAGVWKDGELIEEESTSDESSVPVKDEDKGNNEQKYIGTIYNNSDRRMSFYINDKLIAIVQPQSSIRALLPYGNVHVKALEDVPSNEQGISAEHTKYIDGPEWTITFGSRF